MTEIKGLYIVKINDRIKFKTSLETKYGIITKCYVKDADIKICDNCNMYELKNIKEGEVWMFVNDKYFCDLCFKSKSIEPIDNLDKKYLIN